MAIELGKVNVTDLTENEYKILGIGLNRTSDKGGIFPVNFTTLTQAKDNLTNLILTKKGERLMNPDFGCDVWRILFEPIVEGQIETQIENTIIDAVSKWLPYLNIDEIVFDYDENDIDTNKVNLEVKFSLTSNSNLSETINITINN
jgi:phage baseplate assembly protein W